MRYVLSLVVVLCCSCYAFADWHADLNMVPVNSPSAVPNPDSGYVLPYRNEQAGREAATASGIQALVDATNRNGAMLGELLNLEKGRAAAPRVIEPPKIEVVPPTLNEKIEAKKEEVKEKVDALLESPFARHAAILLGLTLICLLGHAIYVKCHADRAKITAGLSRIPVVGAGLAAGFNAQDAFNTAVDSKVQKVKDELHAKVDAIKDKSHAEVVEVALATPAPSQVSPVVPIIK